MNQMWKRVMSLALSGVLLVGSLPLNAWATEGTNPPENQSQPEPTAEAAKYVKINGVAVTEDKLPVVDGAKTLTLNSEDNLQVETIEIQGQPLTINVVGANEIDAGNAVAITTDSDLTISGTGSLKINTSNDVAVEIALPEENETNPQAQTQTQDEEDDPVLTIKDVQLWVMVTPVETAAGEGVGSTVPSEPVAIVCEGGVVIQGAAHFRTSHSRTKDTYVMECDGYFNSEGYKKETAIAGGLELVFVGADHLTDWQGAGTEKHYKVCKSSDCLVGGRTSEHTASTDSEYVIINNTYHQKVHTCCPMKMEGMDPEEHNLIYTAEGASITAECGDCGAKETFTLTAQNIESGSGVNPVTFQPPAGVLSGKITEDRIVYQDEEGNTLSAAPDAIGSYTVSVSIEGIEGAEAKASFSITKIDFSKATITLDADTFDYDGKAHEPVVTEITLNGVQFDPATVQIEYSNNINATTEESKAAVTITMPSESEYVNAAVKNFTINAKEITADDVKLGEALTYNRQEQEQTVVAAAENSDVTFTVTDNKKTNAGDYKLTVTGTGNYKGTLTLDYTIAKANTYKDVTNKEQIVGKNTGKLELPAFTGFGDEKVKGSCTYTFTYNNNTIDVSETSIQNEIDKMAPGAKATLSYIFTPASDSNYREAKTGEIEITKVNLFFILENGDAVTPENVKKKTTAEFGDTDIINTDLIAKVNNTTGEKGVGFSVKYLENKDDTEKDAPVVGSNLFRVYYSGTVGQYSFTDILVCEGWITVTAKTITAEDVTAPRAIVLSANADGSAVALLTEANKGKIGTDKEALVYRKGTTGEYSSEIPTATEAGCYEVFYKPSSKYSSLPEQSIKVLVLPYLTATYGDKLSDITLPDGFSFNETAHPKLDAKVGNAGVRTVTLDYSKNGFSKSEQQATLKVNPKTVTAGATLSEDYDLNGDGYVSYSNATKEDLFTVKVGDSALTKGTDYTVKIEATTDGLTTKHTFTSKEGSNYQFAEFSETAKLYRVGRAELTKDNFPEDLLKDSDYATLDKAKKALTDKLKGDEYPEEYMKFFKVYLMKQSGARLVENQWQEYMEEDMEGFNGFTYEIPYTDLSGATEKDSFKVALIYIAGEDAGALVELDEDDYATTSTGLKIKNLKREAIVCVAKAVDLKKEYKITKAITLDGKSSTQGTLTVQVDSKSVSKTTYGKTVKVTATAKSGYSIVSVIIIDDASGKTISHSQSGSTYQFNMPAGDVTVKMSLKKTTSSTKNPSSGDTSNIYLWAGVLGVSTAALVALLAIWFWKRRK